MTPWRSLNELPNANQRLKDQKKARMNLFLVVAALVYEQFSDEKNSNSLIKKVPP